MIKIVTIAAQRSGTKLLGSLFNTGTQITSFGELFNPDDDAVYSFRSYLERIGFKMSFQLGSEKVLDTYIDYFSRVCRALHFDIMFNQMEYCCVSWNPFQNNFALEYLRSRGFIIVLLTRNPKDIFISQKVLSKTGKAHTHGKPEALLADAETKRSAITLDKNEFVAFRSHYAAQIQTVKDRISGHSGYIEIEYESLSQTGRIPGILLELIRRVAVEQGEVIDIDRVQLDKSVLRKSDSSKYQVEWI